MKGSGVRVPASALGNPVNKGFWRERFYVHYAPRAEDARLVAEAFRVEAVDLSVAQDVGDSAAATEASA
jgi:hypothetical protein